VNIEYRTLDRTFVDKYQVAGASEFIILGVEIHANWNIIEEHMEAEFTLPNGEDIYRYPRLQHYLNDIIDSEENV